LPPGGGTGSAGCGGFAAFNRAADDDDNDADAISIIVSLHEKVKIDDLRCIIATPAWMR